MINFKLLGSSHGAGYSGEIVGLPTGYQISVDLIKLHMALRRSGIGRSERQNLEKDDIVISSGLDASGRTNGEPLYFFAPNVDNAANKKPPITALRSGHADLVGSVKYNLHDARSVAEFASGRSTLPHTIVGAICKQILAKHNIFTYSYTLSIGQIKAKGKFDYSEGTLKHISDSSVRCPDEVASLEMTKLINKAREDGDTLGGICSVNAVGVPMGIGDFHDYKDKLDGLISGYLMSIPSVKGLYFGQDSDFTTSSGVKNADKLQVVDNRIVYASNNCGGVVGGMSNGMPINVCLLVKPVPTTRFPVDTVDLVTKQRVKAHYERSDICVVPNIGIVGENMLATIILQAMNK